MFTSKRWSVMLLLLMILGFSIPVGAIGEVANFEAGECPFEVPEGYTVDCGTIEVPESRDASLADDSNAIRLAVARVHSLSDTPLPDPVIYLEGGPGGYSLIYGDFYIQAYAPILETRDLILLDQRGVGYSEPNLICSLITELYYELLDGEKNGEMLDDEDISIVSDQTYLQCRDGFIADGVNINAYTSAENAADVRDIVKAFGYEQVNLFGISYGTRLALTIMRDYPEIVRSVVLDAVYPPNVDREEEFATNAYRAFKTLFDACKNDSACDERYPNLEQVFFDTVNKLNTNPEMLTYYDFYTDTEREILMDGDSLIYSLFNLLYQSPVLYALPSSIYKASNGIYDTFLDDGLYSLYASQFFSDGLFYTMECYEELGFTNLDEVNQNAQDLPTIIQDAYLTGSQDYLDFCQEWTNNNMADPRENEPVVSDIPTLLTVGSYDPITPPAWAELAAETLSNHYYYEFPSTGHSAFFGNEACAGDVIFAFIDNPNQTPDTSCIAEMQPLLFVPPLVTEVAVVPYSNDELGFSAVAPDGWLEVDNADFQAYESVSTPGFVYRFPESVDEYVNRIIFGSAYNYTELPEAKATIEANDLSWQVYYIENPRSETYSAFAFATSADEVAYVIAIVASQPEERDALYEGLMLKAIDAFVPNP
jgi:pimeloyl-ACP methyl ester carboxylesterase